MADLLNGRFLDVSCPISDVMANSDLISSDGGNASMVIQDVLYRFGYIPVGVHSYVGSMPAASGSSRSAGSGGDFIVFHDNSRMRQ